MKARLILGIGPGKSGSTWLFTFLRSNRNIVAASVKETGYFVTAEDPNLDQYLHRFFDYREPRNIFSEVSNTYIYHPFILSRLSTLDADIDLIAILRDPIERAVSHARHLARNGEKFLSFEDAIYRKPDILSRGLYSHYLQQFEGAPKNIRVHVFDFNQLRDNEWEFQKILARRLGLDSAHFSVSEARRFNGARPRFRAIALVVKWLAMVARQLGFVRLIQQVKDSWIPQFLYAESKPTEFAHLQPDSITLSFMKEYFRQSDSIIGERWGIDVRKWSSQLND